MNGYLLSRTGLAKHAYYMSSVDLQLTSVEELLFFLEHNTALIDDRIVDFGLTRWLGEEFGLTELALRMEKGYSSDRTTAGFLLPLFTASGWLAGPELRAFAKTLAELDSVAPEIRLKRKADALVKHRRFGRALQAYREAEALADTENRDFLSEAATGAGIAAMQLLEYDRAASEFLHAFTYRNTRENLKNYLIAFRLGMSEEDYLDELDRLDVDEILFSEIEDEIQEAFERPVEVPNDIRKAVDELRNRYHREAGT